MPFRTSSAPRAQTPHAGLTRGAVIGNKYRIDGLLGEGGMGTVLSATHLELDAPVAIKVVRDELAKDQQVASSLLFEARAAARMRSKHIVRVLDVSRLPGGTPYIVMEQLQGQDLGSELAERRSLPVAEAVGWVLQACEGLAEAHALGIIHRDLKPGNLFLASTPEGVVLKILDFGISKNLGTAVRTGRRSTLTKSGLTVGSPYYMSPEQMRASPQLDGRADIWSLGAILFELLTGRCPFESDKPTELCSKVLTAPTPSLRSFSVSAPVQLDAIVQRCLEKDPDARYQTVPDLADALREFEADYEQSATSDTTRLASGINLKTDPPLPPVARRGPLALYGVCALLLVAGVGFWQLQGRAELLRWFPGQRADAAELAAASSAAPAATPARVEVTPVPVAPEAHAAVANAASATRPTNPVTRAQPAANWHEPPEPAAPVEPIVVEPSTVEPAAVEPPATKVEPIAPATHEAPAAPVRDGVSVRYDL